MVCPALEVQKSTWKGKFENILMQAKEDPQAYTAKVDEVVNMLACLDAYGDTRRRQ